MIPFVLGMSCDVGQLNSVCGLVRISVVWIVRFSFGLILYYYTEHKATE